MTLQEHIEKIIIPTIIKGKTDHSVAILTAMIVGAYKAGYGAPHNPKLDDRVRRYLEEDWCK